MESKFVVDEDATTNLLRTNAMTHDPMTNYGVVTEEYPVGYLSILRNVRGIALGEQQEGKEYAQNICVQYRKFFATWQVFRPIFREYQCK
jgi:hypothetical protein